MDIIKRVGFGVIITIVSSLVCAGDYLCLPESSAGHKWVPKNKKFRSAFLKINEKYVLKKIPASSPYSKIFSHSLKIIVENISMKCRTLKSKPIKLERTTVQSSWVVCGYSNTPQFKMNFDSKRFIWISAPKWEYPTEIFDVYTTVGYCRKI